MGGPPPDTNYLFLGGYINRGLYPLETLCYLLALKVRYPSRVYLLRGGHENPYGVLQYANALLGKLEDVYNREAEDKQLLYTLYKSMPIAAVVDNNYFCVPSGISPSIDEIRQLNELDRFVECPQEGPLLDLSWAEPEAREGWQLQYGSLSYAFGPDILRAFLDGNGLTKLIRGRQLVMDVIIHNIQYTTHIHTIHTHIHTHYFRDMQVAWMA
eukprot:TRINITY_DN4475_c0_g1_i5.p1 TRINITY_DN4475_c0_g1~~TRINITY_DN4475_c0_g1_i5.p1  ORF type:complete len:213 (+),score=8.78 TRINITY_DN4475_c0_g1_i5:401-1039(+)